MYINLIYALIVLDAFLFVAFMYILRRLKHSPLPADYITALKDIADERRHLDDLRSSVYEDLSTIESKTKGILGKVKSIATEAEMEVTEGRNTIKQELDQLLDEMSEKLKEPLAKYSKKRNAIENLLEQIREEKRIFNKLVLRSEKITAALSSNSNYDDVIDDIITQKYHDARALIARGHSSQKISEELGLKIDEVKMLKRSPSSEIP